MTCDSSRPCNRCKLRGLSDTCEDAPRKRKKYLLDVPNTVLTSTTRMLETDKISQMERSKSLGELNHGNGASSSIVNLHLNVNRNQNQIQIHNQNQNQNQIINHRNQNGIKTQQSFPNHFQATVFQHSNTEPIFSNQDTYVFNNYPPLNQPQTNINPESKIMPETNPNRRTNFLSSAADLEYSTLSSILQNNITHPNHSTSNEGTPSSLNLSPEMSPHLSKSTNNSNQSNHNYNNNPSPIDIYETSTNTIKPKKSAHRMSQPMLRNKSRIYDSDPHLPKCDETINQYFLGPTETEVNQLFPNVITAIEAMKQRDPNVFQERNAKLALSFTIGIVPEDNYNYHNSNQDDNGNGTYEGLYKEPEEIYVRVTKPFSYTPGFHSLIAYLRKRFPKPMLVKMAESMAAYRPSFIACTNSLKECDLIFMEQCFQRTLLTYDNFIKVNGTPTIVWRRTGEIAYVGIEFCMLTGWTKDELIGNNNRKFIVELLDDKSVVEYFQLFLRIAFGDFLGATMTECTLLTPKPNVKIRTGCMWTLKRDVFGIPMMIIGNFLPIL